MATTKHSVEVIKPQLELDEQLPLQEKGWKVQRIGWALILLVPLLGALGLFGEGVLSSRQATEGSTTTRYDRFYRYEKEMKIEVSSTADHIATISMPQQYIKNFRIMRIVPEPQVNRTAGNQVVFEFEGTGNRQVSIYAVPENYGSVEGAISVNNQAFSLSHFIYP